MPHRSRGLLSPALSFASLASLATLASLVACSSGEQPSTADGDLVGGAAASAGQFPSTLNVRSSCTTAKVGPRHILTAAHCVVTEYSPEDPVRYDFRPGAVIHVTNSASLDTSTDVGFRAVTIKKTHVHPGYAEAASTAVPVLGREVPPDVAVIELDESAEATLADIPDAAIDLTPVRPGDPLVIMGYGCELGVNAEKDYSKARLKFKKTTALGIDSQLHEGSRVTSRDSLFANYLERQYVFTPGAGQDAPDVGAADGADGGAADGGAAAAGEGAPRSEEASLCPGDSGGPVYREDGASRLIVGVNAYYSFKPQSADPSRVSVTNWHTRLDGESRFDIAGWLASIPGVRLHGPPPSDRFARCTNEKSAVCGAIADAVKADPAAFGKPGSAPRFEQDPKDAAVWRWTQSFEYKKVALDRETNAPIITEILDETRCAPDKHGKYCGVTLGDPQAKTLYTCERGAIKERVVCSTVCQSNPSGVPDACAADGWRDYCEKARKDGRYCGGALGDGNPKALYQCVGKRTFKKIECAKACSPQPSGVPDKCKP